MEEFNLKKESSPSPKNHQSFSETLNDAKSLNLNLISTAVKDFEQSQMGMNNPSKVSRFKVNIKRK